jgi:hypothetical protein
MFELMLLLMMPTKTMTMVTSRSASPQRRLELARSLSALSVDAASHSSNEST